MASLTFLGLMVLVQPPIVFWIEERFRSAWLLGLPFFYVYLGFVYFAMIAVLIWTVRRKV